jgi:hypothetical protein
MPVEVVGQQLRIRVVEPSEFKKYSFRTQELDRAGNIQRVAGVLKSNGMWTTQAIHFNLNRYKRRSHVLYQQIANLKQVPAERKRKAKRLAEEWFEKR